MIVCRNFHSLLHENCTYDVEYAEANHTAVDDEVQRKPLIHIVHQKATRYGPVGKNHFKHRKDGIGERPVVPVDLSAHIIRCVFLLQEIHNQVADKHACRALDHRDEQHGPHQHGEARADALQQQIQGVHDARHADHSQAPRQLSQADQAKNGGGARDGGGQQHFHQREDDHHEVQPVQSEREEAQAVDQQPQKQLQKEEAGENRVQDVQDAFCTWPQVGSFFGLARIANGEADVQASVLHGCGHDDDVAKDQPGDDHLKHIRLYELAQPGVQVQPVVRLLIAAVFLLTILIFVESLLKHRLHFLGGLVEEHGAPSAALKAVPRFGIAGGQGRAYR
mmetsp:Transcript_33902/g.81276  ORF Transcript_33902/g.81276 Transcript_33902/m.81276 type:complete len:336 (+) Transcript_33902:567-1574(+)